MYMLTGWKKIHHQVYDAGGKIIFIKQKLLTSILAIIIGANSLVIGVIYSFITYNSNQGDGRLILIFGFSAPLAVLGFYLLIKGIEGHRTRKESGGIHPTDTLHILDGSSRELRRCVGNIEEKLADFDNLKMEIIVEHGKNTRYYLQLAWADKKVRVASSGSKAQAEKLLMEIKQQVGMSEPS